MNRLFIYHFIIFLLILQGSSPLCAESPKIDKVLKTEETAKSRKPKKSSKPVKIPKELIPYEIFIDIKYENSPLFSTGFKNNLNSETESHLENNYGPSWNIHFAKHSMLIHTNRLSNLNPEQLLNSESIPEKHDKLFFITVTSSGASYIIQGREWDATTRELTEIHSAHCYQRDNLSITIFKLINTLFQPLLVIDRVDAKDVFLRAFAGELVPQNKILVDEKISESNSTFLDPYQIQPGSVLVTYYRYFDKKKTVRKIQPVDWTYLSVNKVNRATVESTMITGLRNPLSTKRLRRVELIAMLKKPLFPESQVTLFPTKNRSLPFAGLKVRVERKINRKDEPESEPVYLWTNREGEIIIPRGNKEGSSIAWLYAQSGEVLVARVPFVPGIQKYTEFELPDDSIRLTVEGELALLESALIISVTKRTILFARVKKLLLDNKWDRIEAIFKELNKLEKPETFKQQLSAIRVNAIEKVGKNRKAANQIKKLCQNMGKLINRYIDPRKIRDFQTEVSSLKDENETDVKKWLDEQQKKEEAHKKKNTEKNKPKKE